MPTWILAIVALSIAVTAALSWVLLRINASRLSSGDIPAGPVVGDDEDED